MARFDIKGGGSVDMEIRPDTNDYNVCYSILTEDEYGIPRDLSGTAVDIGAHIGAATVALLEKNPGLRVIAVEPVPDNLALLRNNTRAYGERVEIIAGAAGKGDQTLAYLWSGSDEADVHRFIANQHFGEGTPHETLTVPGVTLSELVERYGDIAFLKIDCEGCETDFLDDDALEHVAKVAGEYHNGPKVELRFDKPKRRDPGEKPANRRKRGVA